MNLGPAEILVILVVALIVFGPKRLPEVGRQVGAAVRELRRMQDSVRSELDSVLHPESGTGAPDAPPAPAPLGDAAAEPDHSALPAPPAPTSESEPDGFGGPPGSFL